MALIQFIAWGAVDVETQERMQRRRAIRKIREELAAYDILLTCGGQRSTPWYSLSWGNQTFAQGGDGALKAVAIKALEIIDERNSHGGVRSSGCEAPQP
jgi:hypothetical protein